VSSRRFRLVACVLGCWNSILETRPRWTKAVDIHRHKSAGNAYAIESVIDGFCSSSCLTSPYSPDPFLILKCCRRFCGASENPWYPTPKLSGPRRTRNLHERKAKAQQRKRVSRNDEILATLACKDALLARTGQCTVVRTVLLLPLHLATLAKEIDPWGVRPSNGLTQFGDAHHLKLTCMLYLGADNLFEDFRDDSNDNRLSMMPHEPIRDLLGYSPAKSYLKRLTLLLPVPLFRWKVETIELIEPCRWKRQQPATNLRNLVCAFPARTVDKQASSRPLRPPGSAGSQKPFFRRNRHCLPYFSGTVRGHTHYPFSRKKSSFIALSVPLPLGHAMHARGGTAASSCLAKNGRETRATWWPRAR